jgi:hypothetical protein
VRVLFLFIGEPHHLFHSVPIAAELVRTAGMKIEIAVAGEEHHPYVSAFLQACPNLRGVSVKTLSASRWRKAGAATPFRRSQMRLPTLLSALPYLRGFDAIVVPERTTTVVRRLLGRTKLIFTPHGAGDRAILLDRRDALFDFVLVAGEKSERRLLEAGTIRPGAYAVPGYVKLDYLSRQNTAVPKSFDNKRPTVLYSPHFRLELSSWKRFGRAVIERFRTQDHFNLIVAPHIRLFNEASAHERLAWEELGEPGKIIVDTGSAKLIDMSYTREANVYLGDVSSQVYEFAATPRPCVFLNSHDVSWSGNPDYAFWNMGEVVTDLDSILPAIHRAAEEHVHYKARQCAAIASSFGEVRGAAGRSAEAIALYLQGQAMADERQPRLRPPETSRVLGAAAYK